MKHLPRKRMVATQDRLTKQTILEEIEAMDDATIQQDVLDELDFEPSIDAADIGVSVDEGVVSLSGHVTTYAERAKAEKVASRVKGVRGIVVNIEVRPIGSHQTADDEIAKRILHTLEWNTSVPDDAVKVKVRNGWVTLSGDVEWNFQKDAAARAIRGMAGITGITNSILIKPALKVADVRKRIEDAFKRDAELEAGGIRIAVSDGRVTLNGKVKNWSERQVAERAAWSAPGVKAVEDHIAVS
ncbi:BON domain-containing protein [Roseovarius bejariae]|nr:BON domain-containing protein [Roseovarius bejariae]